MKKIKRGANVAMTNLSTFVKRIQDIMRNDAGINGDAQRIEQIAWMLFLKVYDAKEQDWEFDEEEYQSIIPEPCRWRNWAHDEKDGKAMTGDALLDFVNNILFPVLKGRDYIKNEKVEIPGIQVTASTPIVGDGAAISSPTAFAANKKLHNEFSASF